MIKLLPEVGRETPRAPQREGVTKASPQAPMVGAVNASMPAVEAEPAVWRWPFFLSFLIRFERWLMTRLGTRQRLLAYEKAARAARAEVRDQVRVREAELLEYFKVLTDGITALQAATEARAELAHARLLRLPELRAMRTSLSHSPESAPILPAIAARPIPMGPGLRALTVIIGEAFDRDPATFKLVLTRFRRDLLAEGCAPLEVVTRTGMIQTTAIAMRELIRAGVGRRTAADARIPTDERSAIIRTAMRTALTEARLRQRDLICSPRWGQAARVAVAQRHRRRHLLACQSNHPRRAVRDAIRRARSPGDADGGPADPPPDRRLATAGLPAVLVSTASLRPFVPLAARALAESAPGPAARLGPTAPEEELAR